MSEEYQKLVVEVLHNMEPTPFASEALTNLRHYVDNLHLDVALLKDRLEISERKNVELLRERNKK